METAMKRVAFALMVPVLVVASLVLDAQQTAPPDTILMRGGSCIIGPLGQMLTERVFDEDAVLTAEIDPGEVARGKYDFDVTGHYARPDVFRLMVNEKPQPAVQTNAPAVFGLQDVG